MNPILFAWELGANLGHVAPVLGLAGALRAAGHAVVWSVARPERVGARLHEAGFEVLPAPHAPEPSAASPPVSYSDILLHYGYNSQSALLGLVAAWRGVITHSRAAVVVADHAPTALLAARTLGLPAVQVSRGFADPPLVSPTPNLRPWMALPPALFEARDAEALANINAVLGRFGRPPLRAVADLLDVAEHALLTFPELDHYEGRVNQAYLGPLPDEALGVNFEWPAGPGPRWFAYLRGEVKHAGAALVALRRLGHPTVVYFPGLSEKDRDRLTSPTLRFLREPANMAQVTAEADAALTYGGGGTVLSLLSAGKPLFLLPGHLEQFLVGRRAVALGAAAMLGPDEPAGALDQRLAAWIADPGPRRAAARFADTHRAHDPARAQAALAARISAIAQREAP